MTEIEARIFRRAWILYLQGVSRAWGKKAKILTRNFKLENSTFLDASKLKPPIQAGKWRTANFLLFFVHNTVQKLALSCFNTVLLESAKFGFAKMPCFYAHRSVCFHKITVFARIYEIFPLKSEIPFLVTKSSSKIYQQNSRVWAKLDPSTGFWKFADLSKNCHHICCCSPT